METLGSSPPKKSISGKTSRARSPFDRWISLLEEPQKLASLGARGACADSSPSQRAMGKSKALVVSVMRISKEALIASPTRNFLLAVGVKSESRNPQVCDQNGRSL